MKGAPARTGLFKVKERKIRGQRRKAHVCPVGTVTVGNSHQRRLVCTGRKLVGGHASRPGSSTGPLREWLLPISNQACRACLTISPPSCRIRGRSRYCIRGDRADQEQTRV